MITATG